MVNWVHTYDNHVQVFMHHMKTEKSGLIDKNLCSAAFIRERRLLQVFDTFFLNLLKVDKY